MQERGVKPAAEDILSCPGASLMNIPLKPPIDHVLKCPRCDSYNTKFCYFNNYSLSQPRHFCKNCRRYWTKGGSLRNVPVGGGCRKNKRSSSKQKSSSDLQINADSAISSLSGSDNINPSCSVFPDNLSEPGPNSTVYGLMPIQGTQINHSSAPSLFRLPAVFPSLQNGIMGLDFAAPIRPGHGDFSALLNAAPHQLHLPKESFNLALDSLNGMNSEVQWKLQQSRPEEQEGQKLHRLKHPSYIKPGFTSFSHCLKVGEGQGAAFEGVSDHNYWNINEPWTDFCANYGASTSPLLQ